MRRSHQATRHYHCRGCRTVGKRQELLLPRIEDLDAKTGEVLHIPREDDDENPLARNPLNRKTFKCNCTLGTGTHFLALFPGLLPPAIPFSIGGVSLEML